MDDAQVVRGGDPARDLRHQFRPRAGGERAARQAAVQRPAGDQFHGDERAPAVLAQLVHLNDERVPDRGHHFGFSPEPGRGRLVRGVRNHLESDFAIQARVPGAVHDGHPAAPEFAQDLVPGNRVGGGTGLRGCGAVRRRGVCAGCQRVGGSGVRIARVGTVRNVVGGGGFGCVARRVGIGHERISERNVSMLPRSRRARHPAASGEPNGNEPVVPGRTAGRADFRSRGQTPQEVFAAVEGDGTLRRVLVPTELRGARAAERGPPVGDGSAPFSDRTAERRRVSYNCFGERDL